MLIILEGRKKSEELEKVNYKLLGETLGLARGLDSDILTPTWQTVATTAVV